VLLLLLLLMNQIERTFTTRTREQTVREVSASWKATRKGRERKRKAEKQNEENEIKFEWTRRQSHKAEIKMNTIKYNKM